MIGGLLLCVIFALLISVSTNSSKLLVQTLHFKVETTHQKSIQLRVTSLPRQKQERSNPRKTVNKVIHSITLHFYTYSQQIPESVVIGEF